MQLAIRAATAGGLAIGVADLLRLQHPIYALVATVLVTDLSPAQTRKLGLARLVGTLLGGTLGAAISSFFQSSAWAVGSGILAAMVLSNLLRIKDAARVSGYVCGIVILNHGSEPWSYAFHRTIETLVGIVIAIGVSVVPKLIRLDEAKLREGREES